MSMENVDKITVEVAYATTTRTYLLEVVLPSGSTIEQGIKASGILEKCPEINLAQNKVGIFSKPGSLDNQIYDGDRIEIYRPLKIDPKQERRKKADTQKK